MAGADAVLPGDICSQCGNGVSAGNLFCGQCGSRVKVACPSCGKENPSANRFCGGCGTALAEPEPVADSVAPTDPVAEPAPSPDPVATIDPVAPVVERPAPPPIPEPSPLAEGMDALARERELQSLLAKANLQRLRAQIRDARRSLDIALEVARTLPPAAVSPVHEMIGDMLAAEERYEQARDEYALANDTDPSRLSAERKLGEMILKAQDEAALSKLGLGSPVMDAEVVQDRLGLATFFSLIVPGSGHLWMRQWAKGAAIFSVFLLSIGMFWYSQRNLEAPARPGKVGRTQTNTVGGGYAAIVFAVLVYVGCLFDLAAQSKRLQAKRRPNPVPAGSREDWEV